MKLKLIDSLESLNRQDLKFIVGGAMYTNSEIWQDSTSQDCKKRDIGGHSKKLDKPALAAY